MNKAIKILLVILTLLVVAVVVALGVFGGKSNMISEKEAAKYKSAAKAASVLTILQGLKFQVDTFYIEQGGLPDNLSDMGMSDDSMGKIRFVDKIMVEGGVIFADVNSEFGKDSVISFRPEKIMGGATLQWSCETNIKFDKLDYCIYNMDMSNPFAIEMQEQEQ